MKNFIFLLVLISTNTFSQSSDVNYKNLVAPKVPLTVEEFSESLIDSENFLKSVTYFDGLGRNIQKILIRNSPTGNDIVQFFDFDEFGNESKKYLPFLSENSDGTFVDDFKELQHHYYLEKYSDNTAYSNTSYTGSPLFRIKEVSKGGDIWKIEEGNIGNKTIKTEYSTNSLNEIKRFILNDSDGIDNLSYYSPSQLFKNKLTNEDGVVSETFTDKNGNKVRDVSYIEENGNKTQIITQYVYDSKNLLRFILSPKMSNHDFQSYDNGQLIWNYLKFMENGRNISLSSEPITATVSQGILTLNFNNNSFRSANLKIGPIVYIDDRLPDYSFGNFECTSCNNNYNLYLSNGFLCIGITTSPVKTTGFSGSYTMPVPANFTLLSNQEVLDNYAHQFKYDSYNRITERKVPGKGWEYTIYDNLDRAILSQDANLRTENTWLFKKYDAFGRIIYTGKYQSSLTRENLQEQVKNYIDANTTNLSNIENKMGYSVYLGGSAIAYTNVAFPYDHLELLSISYYDDYLIDDPSKPSPSEILGQNVSSNVKGLATSKWIKILNDYNWERNYFFYDEEGREISSYFINHNGGYTSKSIKYDFRGNVIENITKHTKDFSQLVPLIIEDKYAYDNAERMSIHTQKINEQLTEVISQPKYDDLGTVAGKKVGGASIFNSRLQDISYKYNIRGWLEKVNNPDILSSSLFAFELKYNTSNFGSQLYDGNISEMRWKSADLTHILKSYSYNYDGQSRLKEAKFKINISGIVTNDMFNERINYDKNGNITFLHRMGIMSDYEWAEYLDYMYYYYDGNKLKNVIDAGHTYEGFADYLTTSSILDDYEYDLNGNLILDRNKGIASISYNHLDLIEQINFSSGANIKYVYNSGGEKKSKIFTNNGNSTVTEYLDGFQYMNGVLQFFPTSEGYVSRSTAQGVEKFNYVYIYYDHLGNNRLSYSDLNGDGIASQSEILSATDYYPFGDMHNGNYVNGSASEYLYNYQGKELQTDNSLGLYDFGSRMYDPKLGRWITPDPQNQFVSPYAAMANNPVKYIDPNGEWAIVDDLVAMAVGGTINVVSNAISGNINSWSDGFVYFGIGAAAAEATLYGGPLAGAAVLGLADNAYTQYKRNGNSFGNFNYGEALMQTTISLATYRVGAYFGGQFSAKYGTLFSKGNPLLNQYLTETTSQMATGFTVGTGVSLAYGNDLESSLNSGFQSAMTSFATSSITFSTGLIKGHYKNKQEQKLESNKLTQQTADQLLKERMDAVNAEIDARKQIVASVRASDPYESQGLYPAFKETQTTLRPEGIATPNNMFEYTSPGGKPISRHFYNAEGKVEFEINFKNHGMGGAHGHLNSIPGNVKSGHYTENHIPFYLIPRKYL